MNQYVRTEITDDRIVSTLIRMATKGLNSSSELIRIRGRMKAYINETYPRKFNQKDIDKLIKKVLTITITNMGE